MPRLRLKNARKFRITRRAPITRVSVTGLSHWFRDYRKRVQDRAETTRERRRHALKRSQWTIRRTHRSILNVASVGSPLPAHVDSPQI